jgi:hypothetical protein
MTNERSRKSMRRSSLIHPTEHHTRDQAKLKRHTLRWVDPACMPQIDNRDSHQRRTGLTDPKKANCQSTCEFQSLSPVRRSCELRPRSAVQDTTPERKVQLNLQTEEDTMRVFQSAQNVNNVSILIT